MLVEPYTLESTAIEGLRVLHVDVVFIINEMAEMSTGLLSPPFFNQSKSRGNNNWEPLSGGGR